MRKDGYWLGKSGYGYGYPMDGPRLRVRLSDGRRPGANRDRLPGRAAGLRRPHTHRRRERHARGGGEQQCEDVLATTRDTYKLYVANVHSRGVPMANVPSWQQQQIAAAQPVTANNTSFRSDQLLGGAVRNPQNEALGSIEDIVMSPQTGKIVYLVIARGGVLGFDEKYAPVPWEDFKVTPTASLLVLDTTKSVMEAAPLVSHDQFATPGHFDQESGKVDAFWKTHLTTNGTIGTNG